MSRSVGLRAELAQVVIGMEIAEAHPFFVGEQAKVGMRASLGIRGLCGEASDRLEQVLHVGVELCRRSSANLLIQLGRGFESVGPGNGNPERGELEKSRRNALRHRGHDPLAKEHAIGIGQMTHHLMRGHLAPSSLAAGRDGLQSANDFFFVAQVSESFHVSGLAHTRKMPLKESPSGRHLSSYVKCNGWIRSV